MRLIFVKAAPAGSPDNPAMAEFAPFVATPRIRWRDLIQPKEHGSWSLALEPVALGLLAAPSLAGGWFALAALAGFLARRPLKIALHDENSGRALAATVAFTVLIFIFVVTSSAALVLAESFHPAVLLPSALAGAIFLYFDIRHAGREAPAEIAGAAAFALLTPAFAAAAGWSPIASLALGFAMLARAVPTVLFVRACVRGGKTGHYRAGPALAAASLALFGAVALAQFSAVPATLPIALAFLFARAAVGFIGRHMHVRARTLGLQELALGAAYVAFVGLTWVR